MRALAPCTCSRSQSLHAQQLRKAGHREQRRSKSSATPRPPGPARSYYKYRLSVFCPRSNAILTAESTDPYSRCTAANGERSMVVNLSDDDLAPRGWRERRGWGEAGSRQMEGWGDASVYELHIRDFR